MVTVPRLAAAVYVAVVQFASFMFDRLVCQIVARRWLRHSFARDSVKENNLIITPDDIRCLVALT